MAGLRDELTAEIGTAIAAARTLQPAITPHRGLLAPGTPLPDSLRAAYERGEVTTARTFVAT